MSDIDKETETLGNRRFKLEERLGSGSMGTVYRAFDRKRQEPVALKALTYRNAAALYRFKREFRNLADVSHDNLVALYELFAEEDDEVFFTMELIKGVNFLDYIRPPQRGSEAVPWREKHLRSALAQLAAGIRALHERDKIHCDIKPNNVLVTDGGRLVILDFGVSRDLAPTVTPQSLYQGLAGTVPYMAPEQAQGAVPMPASDWYAVGVMLYQGFTGKLPFDGSLVDVLSAKVSKEAPSPHDLVSDLPADLVDLCSDLLKRDPDARPDGGEVLMRLGVREIPDDNATATVELSLSERSEAAVVGRRQVLAALNDASEASRRGQATTVFLHGESGMGKTALVQHFLRQLVNESSTVVLAGRCYERELVPYKALDGVVDSLSRYLRLRSSDLHLPRDVRALCQLFPVLMRVDPIAKASRRGPEIADRVLLRRHAFTALRELLGWIAADHPLVLYIDDLHWADADSAALIRELVRPPEPPPILLLASFRSEELEAKPFLRKLLADTHDPSCREIRLEALDAAASRELVRVLFNDEDEDCPEVLLEAIVKEAEGSPFFLEQLVDYALVSDASLTDSIELGDMLAARLAQLPVGAAELLSTLAVAGRPLEGTIVYDAAGLEGDERPLVTALKAAALVRASGSADHIELFHNRLRENFLERMSPAEVKRIHRRLSVALEARGRDDPEALFEHYLNAGDDVRAGAEAAHAAAKARAALAFDRAAHFFRRALELGELDTAEKTILLDGLAESLAHAGRPREAADTYLELSHRVDRKTALRNLQRAAEEYLSSGYFEEGLGVVREVAAEVGLKLWPRRLAWLSLLWYRLRLRWRGLSFTRREAREVPGEELLRTDACWVMSLSMAQILPVPGSSLQSRHLLLALDLGEPLRISRALSLESIHRVLSGELPEESAALRQTALELARSVGDPYTESYYTLANGIVSYLSGRWRDGAEWCDKTEALVLEENPGGLLELSLARRYGLNARSRLGEIALLCQRAPEILAEARERGNVLHYTELCTRLHLVWLAPDDPEGLHQTIDEALAAWSHQGYYSPHYCAFRALCQAELYVGEVARAHQRLRAEWPRLKKSFLLRQPLVNLNSHFLRGRVALAVARAIPGSKRSELELAERTARHIESRRSPLGTPMTALIRAGIAHLRGDEDRGVQFLHKAERGFEAQDMALHVAALRRRRGRQLGGDEGHALVESAENWMAEQQIVRPDRMTAMLVPGFKDE